LAYLRESETERIIVLAHRGGEDAHSIDIPLTHAGIPRSTTFNGLLSETTYIVEDGTLPFSVGSSAAFDILHAAK
ncbi:MAG: hypothetical protein AAFV33_12170, partial [Chloroflexota bacterium]